MAFLTETKIIKIVIFCRLSLFRVPHMIGLILPRISCRLFELAVLCPYHNTDDDTPPPNPTTAQPSGEPISHFFALYIVDGAFTFELASIRFTPAIQFPYLDNL